MAGMDRERDSKEVSSTTSSMTMDALTRSLNARLLFAIFIVSTLISVTYGVPPGISLMQDAELEMPDKECLWNAKSEEVWKSELNKQCLSTQPSLNDALRRIMYGKEIEGSSETHWDWSPFATVIVMHAVSIQMWHVMQCTHSLSVFAVDWSLRNRLSCFSPRRLSLLWLGATP